MLSAYCPGTSIVGAASGKWDGAVTVAGVIIGSAVFEKCIHLSKLLRKYGKGCAYLPKLLGIPFPVLIAALVAAAIFAFFGADKLEGIFSRRLNMPQGER